MAFHLIDEKPDVALAHVVSVDSFSYYTTFGRRTTVTTKFLLFPVDARRPAEGRARHLVACGACRQQVAVDVPSARRTLWRQRCWLAVALVLIAVVLGWWGYLVSSGQWHPTGLGIITVPACSLAILGWPIWASLRSARHAHGVTIAGRQPHQLPGRHTIRTVPPPGPRTVPSAPPRPSRSTRN